MRTVVVTESKRGWELAAEGVDVVEPNAYLLQEEYYKARRLRVINLCRSYRYQSVGYYVSLLAAARGHRPYPQLNTVLDLKRSAVVRLLGEDVDQTIQRAFSELKGDEFVLSIYFGKNLAKRYDRLCRAITQYFAAPLLRAHFSRREDKWTLDRLGIIGLGDIPDSHREFVNQQLSAHLRRTVRPSPRPAARFDLAILYNPEEVDSPSNSQALERFVNAARRCSMSATLLEAHDLSRVAEFDALFIRETTAVNHHTFRFAQRARAEGMVVVDDPESILRCTNKVFLAEAFTAAHIPTPRTTIVHRRTMDSIVESIALPCVVKRPDSSFSAGVSRAHSRDELRQKVSDVLNDSELALLQEFVESEFDWRVGVLAGQPIFACRYHYARGDWRIQTVDSGVRRSGRVDTLALDEVPAEVVRTALAAAATVGDGLYGVDLKLTPRGVVVIEVNDNPNIDAGYEDRVAGASLYDNVIQFFLSRLEAATAGGRR